jgi:hypothetical protein
VLIPSGNRGSRFPIASVPCPWKLRFSRSATFVRSLTPVSCERMARILSVNHGSRFRVARVLCVRNPRFSELRLSGILFHVSLLFGWLRSYREIADRDLLLHNFLTIKNSDEQNADGARSFATCPRRRTARIDSWGFGTYDVLVLMDSRTLIFRWASRRWFSMVATLLTSPSGYRRSRFPATQFPYLRKP